MKYTHMAAVDIPEYIRNVLRKYPRIDLGWSGQMGVYLTKAHADLHSVEIAVVHVDTLDLWESTSGLQWTKEFLKDITPIEEEPNRIIEARKSMEKPDIENWYDFNEWFEFNSNGVFEHKACKELAKKAWELQEERMTA